METDMSNTLPQYIPVSCEFHDRLEDLATLRKQASVSYLDDGGVQQQRDAVIKDVFAREGADYVALSSGETVRMDRLVQVDGYQLADFPPDCAL
jgi:Rho-binding antiterminator